MLRKLSYGLLLAAIALVFWPTGGGKAAFAAVSMEQWSNLPEPIPGASASAVLSGNKILVTGGQNGSNSKSKNSYVFDTISKTWTTNAPTLPVAYHKQSMLQDGRVLVTGGNAFENNIGYVYNDLARIYNPQTNAWTNAANVPHTVLGQTQSTLADGRVMIVGGSNEVYYPGKSITYNNSYIYDPSMDRWDEVAPLPVTLYEAAQSTLKDGRVLLTGGLNGYAYSYSSFIYDPVANTWTKAASLPYAYDDIFFRHSQVTLENGKVLVMGNYNFFIYDPATNNWTKDSENTGHLTDASLVSVGSDVYVVSGYNYLDYSTNTKLYKLTFDFNPPTAPTITGVGSGWNGTDVDVTITPGTDAGTGVDRTEYSLTGATTLAWTTYSVGESIPISQSGQTTITARTIDKAGNFSTTASAVIKIDKTAPSTPSVNLSTSGWAANNVTATLSASSDPGGSGVSRREYSLTGATTLGWTTYSGTVTLAATGETTFHARDIDEVGNVSAEGTAVIKIDKAPPLAPSITPSSTAWNQTDVTVTIAPGTDTGGSGVSRTEYKLSGAKTLNWTTYSISFVIGVDGQTTVEARTIDNAGNISTIKTVTVKLDKTVPTAPTVTPATAAWTNAASVKVAVTPGTDGGSGVSRTEYSLSGATTLGWTTYTGQVTVSAEGQTTLSARTVDTAGNISAVSNGIVKIDRTTPGVPDIKESTIAWTAADATFTLAPGTDTGSGAARTEYMLSGGTTLSWTTYTGAVTITAEGQTTINARTVDQAGNTSGPRLGAILIDKTKPTTPVITPSATGWSVSDVSVSIVSGTDKTGSGVSKTEYKLSGATTKDWTTYTAALSISAEGQTMVEARTIDRAGNISTVATVTVKLDKTKPTAPTITQDASGWTKASSVTATITAGTDNSSGVSRTEYSLSGATTLGWTTYSGQVSVSAEGQTTVSVRSVDNAGNVGSVSTSVIKIDRTAPTIPAISPDDGGWSAASISVTLIAGEDSASTVDRVEYKLTGATTLDWTAYTGPINITKEGITTVSARTIDKAGNVSAESEATQSLDLSAPGAAILSSDAPDWTSEENVTVTAEAGTDSGGSGVNRVEYSLSGAVISAWKPYTGPILVTAEGQTEVSVRTIDNAGNLGTESKKTVKIDQTAPSKPDIQADATGWTSADVKVTVTPGTDGLSGTNRTEYRLLGATTLDWATYSGTITVTAAGETSVQARTMDQAGNISDTSVLKVHIDKTAPIAPQVLIEKEGWISAGKVTFSITKGTDQGGSGVDRTEYKLSGALTKDWSTYVGTVDIEVEGVTTISARTIDAAGNVGPVIEAVVRIDRSSPTIPSIKPETSDWTSADSVKVSITAGKDIGESGIMKTEYRITGEGAKDWAVYDGEISITAEGVSTIYARSVDQAGNIGPTAEVLVHIDRTAPAKPAISPADGVWSSSSISVTLTAGADNALSVDRIEYKLSGATTLDWTTYTVPFDVTKEGQTVVSARTVDKAGNVSVVTEATQSIDLSAPGAAKLSSDALDWTSAESVTVTAESGSDSGGSGVNRVEYSLSGAVTSAWKTYITPIILTAEGQTEVTVRTVDNAGNMGTESIKTVKIDHTAPTKPNIQADATGWTSADIKVIVTPGMDELSGASRTEYRLSGAATLDWTTYTGTITVTATGETSILVRTMDQAGNVSDTSVLKVYIDKTAPTEPQVLVEKEGWISAAKTAFSITEGTDQGGSALDRTEYKLSGAISKEWTTYAGTVDIETEGVTTISARTIDAAGNVGPVTEAVVRIDRTSPTIPSIKPDTTDWTSADSVKVSITEGKDIGESGIMKTEYRITGAGAKNWAEYDGETSITAEGVSTIYARSIDQAGNVGPTAEVNVRIDRTPPSAPVTKSPVNGEVLGDNLPTIAGTAEENSIITITIDGEELPAVTTDNQGSWTYIPVSPLKDGKHQVRVSVKDAVGNTAAEEGIFTFTVDTTAPEAPVIEEPVNDTISGISKPVLKGHAEAGSNVTLYIGDSQIKSLTADEDGNWSYTLVTPLEDGVYVLKARAADAAGNVGPESGLVSWTVDTKAPAAPIVLVPVNGDVTNEDKLTIFGTAEAGSIVTIKIDNKKMAEKKASNLGAWSFTLNEALGDGKHIITAEAADSAGNIGPSSETVEITIDTEAPELAMISAPTEGEQLNKTKPQLSGSAEAGAWIHLTLDGTTVDPFKVGEGGIWSYSPSVGLSEGIHRVKIKVADEAGNVKEDAVELSFVIDTTAPAIPVITLPTDGSQTNVTKPIIVGTAEKQSKVIIVLDGEAAVAVEADEDGNWQYTPIVDLAIGRHVIQVQSEDNAGNESGLSAEHDFEIVSSNAELSKLTLSSIKLNELFQSTLLDYTAIVNYSVSSTEITAVPSDSNATVEILLEDGQPTDKPVKLKVGEQTVTIRVTAQDGTTIQTYTVAISRNQYVAPKPEEPEIPETPEPVKLITCKPDGDSNIQFKDMAGHWANQAVQNAYGCGVVKGFIDGTFHPDAQVTRAEFVTMLMNTVLDSSEPVGSGEGFSDNGNIPAWASNAVAEAQGYGFVNGFSDGSFRPNEQVTRAELVTMLAKAAGIKPLEADQVTGMFADTDTIPAWAAGYVAALQEKGLLQGRGDGKFEPTGHATRAEAAVLLLRIIEFRQN